MASGSKKVIYAAMIGNGTIALAKFVGATITGSAAMVSEGIHSVVDTGNQALLLYGLKRAKRPADAKHPFGYGAEIYFWAFIVAILIFSIGAGISVYHGVEKIMHPHPIKNVTINYVILILAIIFEGGAWWIAYKEFSVVKGNKGLVQAIRESKDPTIFTVLLEDSAAMLGLIIALVGIWIAVTFNIPIMDGVASILIGCVLVLTAVTLALETKGLLIGEAAAPEVIAAIYALVNNNEKIMTLNELRTLHKGPQDVLVALSVEYKKDISITELEQTSTEIEREIKNQFPIIKRVFVEAQSAEQHDKEENKIN